jgi:nucleoside-diphosphate-sugar epimerase
MQAMITAAIKNRVKRIVVTSSAHTMYGEHMKDRAVNTYSELDFASIDNTEDPYIKSKIYQEEVIREFLKEQDKWVIDYKLEIVTLHPSFIVGPTLTNDTTSNSSLEYITRYMRGDVKGVLNMMLPTVDVRDVAFAHYLALVLPNISGERIALS